MKNCCQIFPLIGHFLFVFSSLLSFSLLAEENKTVTSADDKALIYISIASTEIPKLLYKDEQGKLQGSYIELLKKAEAFSHLRFKVHLMPWARALNEVKHNRIDAIMPALYSDERAGYLVYPQKNLFVFGNDVLIKRSSDVFEFENISTIGKDKIIGKVRSTSFGKTFDQAEQSGVITVFEVVDFEQALDMLAKGRLDLVVIDNDIADAIILRLNVQDKVITIPIDSEEVKSYLSFSQTFAKQYNIDEIIEFISQVQ